MYVYFNFSKPMLLKKKENMETNSLISILVALLVILLVTLLILLFVVTFVFISRRIKSNNKELKVVEVVPNNDFNYLKETIGDYLLSKKFHKP